MILGQFASRAFRRPATNQEVQRLVQLTNVVRGQGGTFEESIQVAFEQYSFHFISYSSGRELISKVSRNLDSLNIQS